MKWQKKALFANVAAALVSVALALAFHQWKTLDLEGAAYRFSQDELASFHALHVRQAVILFGCILGAGTAVAWLGAYLMWVWRIYVDWKRLLVVGVPATIIFILYVGIRIRASAAVIAGKPNPEAVIQLALLWLGLMLWIGLRRDHGPGELGISPHRDWSGTIGFIPPVFAFIVAAMLALGAAPLPYGYYTLLHLVACGTFAFAAYVSYQRKTKVIPLVYGALALVFNPIVMVHFSKGTRALIDLASAVLLAATAHLLRRNESSAA